MKLFCFHHAGGSALMYKSLKINGIQICPIQLNCRDENKKPFYKSLIEASNEIYCEMIKLIDENDELYMVFAHSMESWIAYSVLSKMMQNDRKMPIKFIVSAFCHPFINAADSPWISNTKLNDNDFKEILEWGANSKLLLEPYWSIFKDRLRADFSLFDVNPIIDIVKLNCKIMVVLPSEDNRIKEHMVLGWRDITDNFELVKIKGNHFYLLENKNVINNFIHIKALCLHGHLTNANIMRLQMIEYIKQMPFVDFHMINAPTIKNTTYPEVKMFFSSETNYYEWFNCNKENLELNGLDKSLELLEPIIKDYDVLIGFSQGASMVSILASKMNVNKVILICHGKYVSDININSKSLHLIDSKDEYMSCGINALNKYNDKQIIYFEDGHKIPNDKINIEIIMRFIC